MKKYYACFYYNEKPYVVRFRMTNAWTFKPKEHCFEDERYYVRTVDDIVCLAALDSNKSNSKAFGFAYLITHEEFKLERSEGIPRWKPWREVIE